MALAAPINLTVANADFETDAATRNGEQYFIAPPSWTATGAFGTINLDKLSTAFYSAAEVTALKPVHGSQLAAAQGDATLTQTLSAVFAPSSTYTFSVLVGDTYENVGAGNYTLSLMSGSTVLNSVTAAYPGTRVTSAVDSVSYTTGLTGAELTTPITIQITSQAGNTKAYDNVVVTVDAGGTAVPEPASLSLLGLGGAALLRRRRA
jgi:hypothetical protein